MASRIPQDEKGILHPRTDKPYYVSYDDDLLVRLEQELLKRRSDPLEAQRILIGTIAVSKFSDDINKMLAAWTPSAGPKFFEDVRAFYGDECQREIKNDHIQLLTAYRDALVTEWGFIQKITEFGRELKERAPIPQEILYYALYKGSERQYMEDEGSLLSSTDELLAVFHDHWKKQEGFFLSVKFIEDRFADMLKSVEIEDEREVVNKWLASLGYVKNYACICSNCSLKTTT